MIPGLLSVVFPNYNHSAYVGAQLRAVLAESYRNIEVIMIDDASTDNSIAVIEAAIGNDPRVRFFKNEKNQGVQKNLHRARELANGEFIYMCAADDLVLPGLFEKGISLLRQAPQAGISLTQMAWIENNGATIRPMPLRLMPQPTFLPPDAFCDAICGEHIAGHSAIMRMDMFDRATPPLDDFYALKWHSDWFIGTVLACRHGLCYNPEVLTAIRVGDTNYSTAGMYKIELQKVVVKTAFRLLKSEQFRDVLPHFVRGAIFSGIPLVAQIVLSDPELWDTESLLLAQKCISDWNEERRQFQRSRWVQK